MTNVFFFFFFSSSLASSSLLFFCQFRYINSVPCGWCRIKVLASFQSPTSHLHCSRWMQVSATKRQDIKLKSNLNIQGKTRQVSVIEQNGCERWPDIFVICLNVYSLHVPPTSTVKQGEEDGTITLCREWTTAKEKIDHILAKADTWNEKRYPQKLHGN